MNEDQISFPEKKTRENVGLLWKVRLVTQDMEKLI